MSTLGEMSAEARVWIFAAKGSLTPQQIQAIETGLAEYVASWTAHKQAVRGGFEVQQQKFIVIAAEKGFEQVSGCSIDKMFSTVRQLVAASGGELSDPSTIFYRVNGEIRECDRQGFRERISQHEVSPETVVFDPLVQQLSEFRAGKFELPAKASWHHKLF